MDHIDSQKDQALSPNDLATATRALRRDGIVRLAGAVDPAHIDLLRERMLDDLAYFTRRHGPPDDNYQGISPPPFKPYLFADVLLNPGAIQITHALLGDGVTSIGYNANTAFPDSTPQAPHADVASFWPDLKKAHPPAVFVLNVPLVDVDDENGATAYWPGSHLDTRIAQKNRFPTAEMLGDYPSRRMHSRTGDLIIRDARLWHGGMPNRSDRPRPMIAMGHVKPFFTGEVVFEKGCERFFDHPVLTTRAIFVEPPIRYLFQGPINV